MTVFQLKPRKKIKLKLSSFDLRLLIRAVADLRKRVIEQNGPTEDINALLIRLCDLSDQ